MTSRFRGLKGATSPRSRKNNGPFLLPGCINGTRVLTAGALNCDKTWASYTNWGTSVDWVATGTGVYSTYKGGGYATLSGGPPKPIAKLR